MITSIILPPLLGGIIGYVTNDIAIRMLFRPHSAKYFLGIQIPFTPGIIPKEKERIALSLGKTISENLMNKDVLERTLLSNEVIDKISLYIDDFCNTQSKNTESLKSFLSKYFSNEEIDNIVCSTLTDLKSILVKKISSAEYGDYIAHVAVQNAVEKLGAGLLGMFGANKIIELITKIAEPLLAKEINSLIQNKSYEIIDKIVEKQSSAFFDTSMESFFSGRKEKIHQIKSMILSIYRTIILDHLPSILSALNLSNIIEKRINEMDMNELEPIIHKVLDKELKSIVWLGAGLGALIGCANIFF